MEEKPLAPISPMAADQMPTHMAYLRRDVDTLAKNSESSFKELKESLKELVSKSPTRQEFEDLKKEVVNSSASLETLKGDKKWVMGAAAVLILLQGAILFSARLYIKNMVQESLKDALSAYNITVE